MTLKSHSVIWTEIAKHLNTHDKSIQTAIKRMSCGLPFFTTQLPALGKDLEAGLTGKFVLSKETPFSVRRGTSLPAFLYEHFIRIFYKDGYIRPNPQGIADLRFLLKVYYKFESEMSYDDVSRALAKFREVDESVKTEHWPYGLAEVRKNFVTLLPENPLDIRGVHSNGAASLYFTNCEKRYSRVYIPRLMDIYGPKYFFNTISHCKNWCAVNKTIEDPGLPRITFVPKDSRGPRTICIYNHMDMFIQKGLQEKLYEFTEQGDSPARGYINFTDQTINQNLAYKGSIDGSVATIDLKDASDLVSWELVKLLSPPDWYAAFAATRTDAATTRDGNTPLKKFAPMGSALCFPIEAFVFWAIAKTVSPWVYVYGDDIIVPSSKAHDVIAALESYGLIVNMNKTLLKGHFRESCGGDYYNGHNINYASCKSYDLVQYIAFCNEVADRHSQVLAEKLIKLYEELYNEVVYREPLEFKQRIWTGKEYKMVEPLVFYTDHCVASSVFFKRRGNTALQREEILRKRIVSRHEKAIDKKKRLSRRKSLSYTFECTDDDLLFDWFTSTSKSWFPAEDASYQKLEEGIFTLVVRTSSFSEGHSVLRQDSFPVTKYEWGPHKLR